METLKSELPQILGYIALVAILLLGLGVIELVKAVRR